MDKWMDLFQIPEQFIQAPAVQENRIEVWNLYIFYFNKYCPKIYSYLNFSAAYRTKYPERTESKPGMTLILFGNCKKITQNFIWNLMFFQRLNGSDEQPTNRSIPQEVSRISPQPHHNRYCFFTSVILSNSNLHNINLVLLFQDK